MAKRFRISKAKGGQLQWAGWAPKNPSPKKDKPSQKPQRKKKQEATRAPQPSEEMLPWEPWQRDPPPLRELFGEPMPFVASRPSLEEGLSAWQPPPALPPPGRGAPSAFAPQGPMALEAAASLPGPGPIPLNWIPNREPRAGRVEGKSDYAGLWKYLPKSWAMMVRPAVQRGPRARGGLGPDGKPLRPLKEIPAGASDAVKAQIEAENAANTIPGTPGLGWYRKAMEAVKTGVRRHPVMSAMGALFAADVVAPYARRMFEPGLERLTDWMVPGPDSLISGPETRLRRQAQAGVVYGDMLLESQRRQQELDAITRQNAMRLMQMNPALAQQLLAGRRLPLGASVIGGEARVDVLNRAASMMGGG